MTGEEDNAEGTARHRRGGDRKVRAKKVRNLALPRRFKGLWTRRHHDGGLVAGRQMHYTMDQQSPKYRERNDLAFVRIDLGGTRSQWNELSNMVGRGETLEHGVYRAWVRQTPLRERLQLIERFEDAKR